MATPQPGILPEPRAHAYFLVLACPGAAAAARGLGRAHDVAREVAELAPGSGLVLVAGIGARLWDLLQADRRPRGLHELPAIGSAPSTGGDVFLHVASDRHDLDFELASRLAGSFGDARVLEEVRGFRYLDTRDLTGFIDGTENPKGAERAEVAILGDEDPDFRGGSYVATMRFVHDLGAFTRLSEREQEGVIGRTKRDSIELEDKPSTSHVARVVVERDGAELEIVRHSYPYGTTAEKGLFFVAYGRSLDNFETMLARMMGVSGDGGRDRLMDFARPVSGAAFFVPSLEVLRSLA